jgi:hypothetical protein
MGFGPFSSESKAEDSRIAATDQSTVVRGKGKVLRAGAVDLANARVNSGLQLKSFKGNLTITNTTTNSGGPPVTAPAPSTTPGTVSPPPPATTTTPPADTTVQGTSSKWIVLGLLLAGIAGFYFFRRR